FWEDIKAFLLEKIYVVNVLVFSKLAKPPVKDCTRPINLVLHSDMRAMERAEFDHLVLEKLSAAEHYKLEIEKQQKLEEEEELRRLRKELVPKAQPMSYFDRPFVPKRYITLSYVTDNQIFLILQIYSTVSKKSDPELIVKK
ncbi:WVD2-like protein 4, partial [Tanacetum coccineum]